MAAHGARQQKKLAKKNAAREQKRKQLAIRQAPGLPELAAMAKRGTIISTAVSQEIWDEGIGYAWISRALPVGRVAFASFMLDVWCLGVKDVIFNIESAGEAAEAYRGLGRRLPWRTVAPADLRALVHGAVEFAQLIGLAPHPGYHHAQSILEGIEGEARESFVFGRDGKPCFVSGPHDSPTRCRQIAVKVAAAGGHYTIGIPESSLLLVGDDEVELWDDADDSEAFDEPPRYLA